jgi:amino acid transporter
MDILAQEAPISRPPSGTSGLRKSIGAWLVIGVSIALMGPSLSANIDVQPAAPLVGRAIPLTFVIATAGVAFVAWAFIRLSQDFNHAGSVFGLVGATLGSLPGVFAGWALFGTYTLFSITSALAGGIFTSAVLQQLGIWSAPPTWFAYLAALIFLCVALRFAVAPVRQGTRLLLIFEGCTVTLVLIVCVVTAIRLISGSSATHLPFTFSVFTPGPGTNLSSLFLGVVFGFLAFGGFEGACTMGEEATEPRRQIPRAVLGTVLIGGAFYVITSALMVMGFGTSASGLTAFEANGSPLGYLGSTYIAGGVGDLVTIGTMFSAFAAVLGLTIGASRLLFAMTRAGWPRRTPLTIVSQRWGTPLGATLAVFSAGIIVTLLFGWASSNTAVEAFGYLGEMGTLLILVAYVLTVVGALRHFFLRPSSTRTRNLSRWEILIPICGFVIVGYTFYRNVVPYPTGGYFWVPLATAVWLVVGLGTLLLWPGLARRVGAGLMHDPGLTLHE